MGTRYEATCTHPAVLFLSGATENGRTEQSEKKWDTVKNDAFSVDTIEMNLLFTRRLPDDNASGCTPLYPLQRIRQAIAFGRALRAAAIKPCHGPLKWFATREMGELSTGGTNDPANNNILRAK